MGALPMEVPMIRSSEVLEKDWKKFLKWVSERHGIGMASHLEFLDFAGRQGKKDFRRERVLKALSHAQAGK